MDSLFSVIGQDTHVLNNIIELNFGQNIGFLNSIDGALNHGTRDIELEAKVGDGRAYVAHGNNDVSNNNAHGKCKS